MTTAPYEQRPEILINGCQGGAWQGYEAIARQLLSGAPRARVFVVECYPGVDDGELLPALKQWLKPDTVILSESFFFDGDTLTRLMQPYLTDDSVRGVMYWGEADAFIDPAALAAARETLENATGTVLVYGFCAAKLTRGDALIYADMTRWEIQLRYRRGMPNFKQHNEKEGILRKVKRGFFIEWRIADRHKASLFGAIDYYLDTVVPGQPKMISHEAMSCALDSLTKRPFRMVPYFDAGVWGGHWMRDTFALHSDAPNFAWGFDGVPEENSLLLRFGDVLFETPTMNLTLSRPRQFLGEKTFSRFGAEFPIRFDLLDTIGGQNLSLQVHPITEYMKQKFGMPYTQDESYYILDTKEGGGGVYLGVKTGADKKEMFSDLRRAQAGEKPFDADKYVNLWPAAKHDHFLIPAGTIHCSSSGTMVLEISATPYIFTFKLWDWGRVDLNGLPRPIHIDDGERVIQMDRDTQWVRESCVNRFETITDSAAYTETHTGLHPYEFIETRVLTVREEAPLPCDGEFAMCNLVDGKQAVVEGAGGSLIVHYAETFILPANADPCRIRPSGGETEIKLLCAKVRF